MAQAEGIARELAEPALLSQVLETRAGQESGRGRNDLAESLAEEALHWAKVAGDQWAIALAAFANAMAANTAGELQERVVRAESLLEQIGDVYHLADLLTSAAFVALRHGNDRDASAFISRATPIVRQLENRYLSTMLSGNVGLAALLAGDMDTARGAFREELTLCREHAFLPLGSEGLHGLAAVAAVGDDLDRAARLFGAGVAQRHDRPEDPVDARLRAAFFTPAHARHGTEAWDAAAREGGALSFQEAITYALEETPA